MAKIKEEDIDSLRERADIVEVISGYTQMKRAGSNTYKGLCPFHSEKTPSFTLDATKGLWHCLAGETGVMTWAGTIPIAKLAGETHRLLTTGGKWVDAEIKSFGEQRLWAVHLSRNRRKKIIYATDGHRWLLRTKQPGHYAEKTTINLRPGDSLAFAFPPGPARRHVDPNPLGVALGSGGLPEFFKNPPSLEEAPAYLYGWLAGYFAADGCVSTDGQVILSCASKEVLEFVRTLANRLGIGTYGIKHQRRLGLGKELSDLFHVTFISSTLPPEFFVLSKHRERFEATFERRLRERNCWVVRGVEATDRVEEVYCAVVDGTHAFTIEDNILTGNCFGCGLGGNIYHFVQKVENLPFPEAVEWLARRSGYDLRYEEQRPGERRAAGAKARLLAINDAAAKFFYGRLMSSPDAEAARNYLTGRGFGREVAERWQLGYAPGRDALCRHLLAAGFTAQEIEAAGLGRRSDRDGSLYDMFRARITFPTWNLQGEVVGFGARALGDAQPKYLNTPETPVFSKSRLMYGLNRAKSAIARGAAVIVEGYTDVIALHEAGIAEAVATNGVALGESHFELLKKFSSRAVLMFDADEAGRGATERGFGIDRRIGIEVLVAPLPPGRDPADVVREDGADGVHKILATAQPLLEFKLEQTIGKLPLDTPEARARAVREAAEVLGWHPDPIARHEYVFMAARRIGVDVESVQRAVMEGRSHFERREGEVDQGDRERRLPGHVKVEREALTMMLSRPREFAPLAGELVDDDFSSNTRREVFRTIRAAIEAGESMGAEVAQRLSADALSLFTELTVGVPVVAPEDEKAQVDEVFTRLRVFRLERQIEERRRILEKVNPLEDPERHDSLFTELVGLEAERRDLLRQLRGPG